MHAPHGGGNGNANHQSHTTSSVSPRQHTQPASPKIQRAKMLARSLCRLDVCWTLLFFVFLLCVANITTSVTQAKICEALLDSWQSLHGARIESFTRRLSIGLDRVHDIATVTAALHLKRSVGFGTEATVKVLCSSLDNFDKYIRLRALLVLSKNSSEAAGCMHGLSSTGSMRTLTAFTSENHMVKGSYLIDNSTYAFTQPRQMMSAWSADRQNLSVTMPIAYDNDPVFLAAGDFYAGKVNDTDLGLRWTYRSAMPHLIIYTLPAGFLTRGMTSGRPNASSDFLQVRLDGSLLLTNYDYFEAPDFSVAAFMNFSLRSADPVVLSNNWGQPSASNTSLYTPSAEANVTYLHASNISNPLMRAALKHVKLAQLQYKGYRQSTFFSYRGAKALVTAYTFSASQGLTVPLVLVSAQERLIGPYCRILYICDGIVALAVVVLTLLFWSFVHVTISHPLEDITVHLQSSLHPGKRALLSGYTHECMQLTEVKELLQVYNETMKQLREIDSYLPEALRERIGNGTTLDEILTSNASLATSRSLSALAQPASSLIQLQATVVCIRVRGRRTNALEDALVEMAEISERPLRYGERLTAVVKSAAQATSLINTGPFPSRAALAAFVTAVHELSSAHHGVVHTLTPDSCTVHFMKAVHTYLLRHPSAMASASAETPMRQPRRRHLERLIAWDACEAVAFALALQQWADRFGTCTTPDIRVVVDTSSFTCGQYRAEGSEQTMSVAFGRDVMREVGHVPEKIGVRVAMTEETAVRVRDGLVGTRMRGVRQLPVEALCLGRAGLDADVVILYEALPGPTRNNVAWHRYSGHVFDGFALMLRGDYAGAHRALSQVAEIADLEPGLMPARLRRESAPSDVTGGAVSTQASRLLCECEQRLAAHITTGFYRLRRVPLGIDAVLKGTTAARASAASRPEVHHASAGETHRRGLKKKAQLHEPLVNLAAAGMRAPVEMALCKSKERYVMTVKVDGQSSRHAIADPPRWLKDNYGMHWYVPAALEPMRYVECYKFSMTGLGSAGLLATITAFLLRDVPPLVAKVIRNAPEGIMSDELRSAVPVCEPSAEVRKQLLQMFYGQRQLRHPSLLLPEAYTYSLEGGVAMIGEYCPGGSLRDVIERYNLIQPLTSLRFGLCVTSGLAYLHSKGCVHGALSGDTVMVGADGVCRLTGYFADYARANALFVLHHTYYVSPAMARGEVPTPACDMFCYGLIAVEVLTRQAPWRWALMEEGQAQPSEEDLRALMKEGGSKFCAAVVEGRVVPRLALLDARVVTDHYNELARDTVRNCLSYNPDERPTAAQAREVNCSLLAQRGLTVL